MVDLTNPFGNSLTPTPTVPPAQSGYAVVDVANQLAQAYLDYKKNKDLNKLNLRRIQAGLPTLSADGANVAANWNIGSSLTSSSTIPIVFTVAAVIVLVFSLMGGAGGGRRR